jgi:hypothetical protein
LASRDAITGLVHEAEPPRAEIRFRSQAERTPERKALCDGTRSLTYGQVNDLTDRCIPVVPRAVLAGTKCRVSLRCSEEERVAPFYPAPL